MQRAVHGHLGSLASPLHYEFPHSLNPGANEGKGLIHTLLNQMPSNVPDNSCFCWINTHTRAYNRLPPFILPYFLYEVTLRVTHSGYIHVSHLKCWTIELKTMLFQELVRTPVSSTTGARQNSAFSPDIKATWTCNNLQRVQSLQREERCWG